MSFTTIIVTGRYSDATTGAPVSGTVTLTRGTTLRDTTTGEIVLPDTETGYLDSAGLLRLPVVATTDPTTTPSGTLYTVTEAIGGATRTYTTAVPYNQTEGVLDLSTVAPARASEAWALTATRAAGVADPLVVHPWAGVNPVADATGSPHLIVGGTVGETNPAYATAVIGNDTPAFDLTGIHGKSGSGTGVSGQSTSGTGVSGFAVAGMGVNGFTMGSGTAGVEGDHYGTGPGVLGTGVSGPGVQGTSTSGPAIHAAGYVFLANHAEPATPSGGGVLYVESGSLKYKGSSGTVTTLGPA